MAKVNLRESGALFSIGQMAQLFGLNVRTLRYYDQIGLLEPESVDPQTGYRRYSSAQFERLNTIRYLRAIDVPIERIAAFLGDREVGAMRGIFEEQLESVLAKQRELERIERKIRGRITQIDQAVQAELGVPEAVRLPARRIVALAESFAPDADLEPLIRDLSARAGLHEAIFLGKVGVSVAQEDLLARRFDKLSSVFVILEDGDEHTGLESEVPGGDFARIRFRGTHAQASASYAALMDFAAGLRRPVAGASIETTIIDAGMTSDESQFVTELQVPLG